MLKKIQILILASLLAVVTMTHAEELPILSGVGGNFTAVNTDGQEIEFTSFKDKVVLLSFGYTNCADICPFTLGYLKMIYSKLSPEEQQQVRVLFSTVDPEYDTPEHLKAFLAYFNKDFIGLTGTQEQVDKIASLFHAEYQAISAPRSVETKHVRRINEKEVESGKSDKTTLFNHSIMIYLIDQQGRTRSVDYTGTPGDELISKIRQLINEQA
ncbi:MAG: SCO family protein [Proteobacteria bacterium]|nr:SCO family protein [Pseudomonadota bacterium]